MKSLADTDTYAEVVRRVSELRDDDSAQWGGMSVSDMVWHVREAFRMAMGEVQVARVALKVPGPVAKVFALWVPVQWPKGVATVPELRPEATARGSQEFAEDRAEVVRLLERFATETFNTRHPMFGAMSRADWMRWGYLHTDHHLRQFGR